MRATLPCLLLVAACSGTATLGEPPDVAVSPPGGGADLPDIADTGAPPTGDPPPPCHAWDPLDIDGGSRTYALQTREGSATETHTLGVEPTLSRFARTSFGVAVQADGDPATDLVAMNACGAAEGSAAFELAADGLAVGLDLVAVNSAPVRYLPTVAQLDARQSPRWEENATATLAVDVEIPGCPSPLDLRRSTTATYRVDAYETVDVAALGQVLAARVRVVQQDRVDAGPSLPELCARGLEQLGFIGDRTVTDVRTHRWYVRGVGLVATITSAPDDEACADPTFAEVPEGCEPALVRRLSECSGLEGCL